MTVAWDAGRRGRAAKSIGGLAGWLGFLVFVAALYWAATVPMPDHRAPRPAAAVGCDCGKCPRARRAAIARPGLLLAQNSSGVNTFIQALTPPLAANFTAVNFNTGTNVVTTQTNLSVPTTAIALLQHDPSNTGNMACLFRNKIAATFTVTLGFSAAGPFNINGIAGLVVADSAAGPNIIHWTATQPGFGQRISLYTSFTTFSADIVGNQNTDSLSGSLYWMRIQETNSARNYFISSDGQNFAQIFTELNTAHFTTTRYGWCVAARTSSASSPDQMMTVYSFAESNP